MENTNDKSAKNVTDENRISNAISKQIESPTYIWHESVTVIDLSGRNIAALEDKVVLPGNLVHLNLSHNKLIEVPKTVLILEKLVVLDLSHNNIEYFDDCPEFCHTLELLDVSYNNLVGPPYWIWSEAPQYLTQLNLSNNSNITKSFIDGYLEELLQYNTLVKEVNIQNCRLGKFTKLLGTFSKAISLSIGSEDYVVTNNSLLEIPCHGLDKCCDLKSLKLCNTHIYCVTPSIEMYKTLVEINLAQNNLNGLPNEFCNLENLEICVLSCNKLLYLPDYMNKMQKLCRLYLDSNEMCMLPDTMSELINLKTLDLYDNHLDNVLNLDNLEELDLALNYCDEPDDIIYLERKQRLRLLHENRYNGRKNVFVKSDNDYSSESSGPEEDEELYEIFNSGKKLDSPNNIPPSSPEDWDSDSYWVPSHINPLPNATSPWLYFVKQKMKEGNFCPMDAHPISIAEKIKYDRLINPKVFHESEGQFDDLTDDDDT